MAQNKALIAAYKRIDRKIQEITPQLYAAFCLALHRKYGWGHKRIAALLDEVGAIWSEGVYDPRNMIKRCEEETGICIKIDVNEKGYTG